MNDNCRSVYQAFCPPAAKPTMHGTPPQYLGVPWLTSTLPQNRFSSGSEAPIAGRDADFLGAHWVQNVSLKSIRVAFYTSISLSFSIAPFNHPAKSIT